MARRLAPLLILALLALTAPSALAAASNPQGPLLGVVKHRGLQTTASTAPPATPSGRAAATVPNLTYHGGPVMHSSRVHAIFWSPPGSSFGAGYESTVSQFFADVAAASHSRDNVYASNPQYGDADGWARYDVSFAATQADGLVDVHDPLPANGCKGGGQGNPCLNDQQLQDEVDHVIDTTPGLTRGMGDIYLLYLPQGIDDCESSTSSSCSWNVYCAYHSSFTSPHDGQTVLYTNQPFPTSGCDTGASPNGNASADAVINVSSHEHQETMTDPLGDAWYDERGNENADKCNFNFGTAVGGSGPSRYNQLIDGHQYWVQQNWSNLSSGCVQTLTANLPPVASVSAAPESPVVNTSVQFDGTKPGDPDGTSLTYQWHFADDGSSSTAPNPTHTFTTAGAHDVQLTVTDSDGASATTTKSVTAVASNQPPTCSGGGVTVFGSAKTVSLAAGCSDPDPADSDPTFTITQPPQHGWVAVDSSGVATYNPAPGSFGPDSFTFTASDTHGGVSQPAVESVYVDLLPSCTSTSATVPPGGSADIPLACSDADGDTLTRSVVGGALHGSVTVDQATGSAHYAPQPGFAGADQFSFRASDPHGGVSPVRIVSIAVAAPAAAAIDPPAAQPPPLLAPVLPPALQRPAPPRVVALKLTSRHLHRGGSVKVTWKLAAGGPTIFRVQRCRNRSCSRHATVLGPLTRNGSAGRNSVKLSLRGLGLGSYRLLGGSAKASFTIIR